MKVMLMIVIIPSDNFIVTVVCGLRTKDISHFSPKFFILLTIHVLSYRHGEFVKQSNLLSLAIISFILMTLKKIYMLVTLGGLKG